MKNQAMGFQSDLRTREASAAFAQDSQLEQEFFKSEFKERIKMLSPMMQGKTTCRGFRRVLATVMFWLFTLTTGAIAADGRGSTVVLAKLTPHQVLDGTAKRIGHYDPNQKLRLVFGIQPPNLEEEEQFLQDLQTKGSPLFHKYLTAEGWNARFAPSVDDEQSVVEWATRGGLRVTHRYPNRLLVDVEGPVSAIESAFNLKINAYQMVRRITSPTIETPKFPAPWWESSTPSVVSTTFSCCGPRTITCKNPIFRCIPQDRRLPRDHRQVANLARNRPSGEIRLLPMVLTIRRTSGAHKLMIFRRCTTRGIAAIL